MLKELGFEQTPLGEITLRRRHDSVLGRDVHEIKLNEEFLMSSAFTDGEIALADIALRVSKNQAPHVLVGGLGLGYTAQAALANPKTQSVAIIETLPAIIQWHRESLLPLGPKLINDNRCKIVESDFFALAVQTHGFRQVTGHSPDILLLDIDHSPRHRLVDGQEAFYIADSLAKMAQQLNDDGVFAMWSNDEPDDAFVREMSRVFATTSDEQVFFENPYSGGQSSNTIYIGQT